MADWNEYEKLVIDKFDRLEKFMEAHAEEHKKLQYDKGRLIGIFSVLALIAGVAGSLLQGVFK